ncbi:MAG: adenylate/guanylate cyclase domain-containing protein [Geminicoccaceae bacterium]
MSLADAERRMAAILAADVVGYARLVERDEARTLVRLRDLRREVFDPLVAAHHGRVFKLMGDGAVVEFASVVDAVTCAAAVQQSTARSQAALPPDRRIVLRIGVNLGDVVVDGDDLLGDGVNVAARLEQLCPPGGVLISGAAYDHLKGRIALPVDARGVRRLKNIAEPVRLYAVRLDGVATIRRGLLRPSGRWVLAGVALVALAAGAWWIGRPDTGLQEQPSVAVLPFGNLGGDEATGRLADGLTADIITDLSRFRELDVIAQDSTAGYKGRSLDAREIGRALNVRYVLEGTIQRQEERIRVSAQLIDARTGLNVWTERWDRPAADLFAVQAEIAEQATGRIGGGGAVPEAESRAAHRARPGNLSAYELYLLGQQDIDRSTEESTTEGKALLERAVALDPTLARGWVVLAWAHDSAASFAADPPAEHRAALAAAERALQLDPMDADAHSALATIVGEAGDLARAQAEFETALRLNPGDAETLTHYAGWASTFGQPERGAEAADRAIRLNPNAPAWTNNYYTYAYFMAGRYDDAVRYDARRDAATLGNFARVVRASLLAAVGRTDEARRAVADAVAHKPDLTIEEFLSDPGLGEVERDRLTDTMRKAGFPPCAEAGALASYAKPIHLPECAPS